MYSYKEKNKIFIDKLNALPLREVLLQVIKAKPVSKRFLKFDYNGEKIGISDKKPHLYNFWSDPDKGGSGAINLVKDAFNCDFKEAIEHLKSAFSINNINSLTPIEMYQPEKEPYFEKEFNLKEDFNNNIVLNKFNLETEKREKHVYKTFKFLEDLRGFDKKTIEYLISKNYLQYAFNPDNPKIMVLFFINKKNTAYEMTATYRNLEGIIFKRNGGNGLVVIEKEENIEYKNNKKTALIAESLIDGISYCLLNDIEIGKQNFDIISISGNAKFDIFYEEHLKNYDSLILAFDNDKIGQRFESKIIEKINSLNTDYDRFVENGLIPFPTMKKRECICEHAKSKDFNLDLLNKRKIDLESKEENFVYEKTKMNFN